MRADHIVFMLDALTHDVRFYLGKQRQLRIQASPDVTRDPELMRLIRIHKLAITQQLLSGFDCVRDGLSVAEVKILTAAAQQGKTVSMVRLAA